MVCFRYVIVNTMYEVNKNNYNYNYYITIIQAAEKSVDWGHFRHLSRLVGSQRSQLANE